MIFYVPKLKEAGAWIEFTGNGAANWRGLRNIAGVRKIAIHHSVTNPQNNWQKEVEYIRQIHMNTNGWGGIGYNIIVTSEESNGYAKAVLIGDLASIRAHTPNSKASFGLQKDSGNWYIIGICMVGQLHINNPSPAQLRTVHEICKELIYNEDERLPLVKSWDDVQPHKAFDSTACSGNWDYQRGKIINPDPLTPPTPPTPTPTPDKEPIYISVQSGDGYSNIAKRAGWSYWDDAGRVISDLKVLNPNHPSFARGNKLWASDPAFIVGYKNKPQPQPTPEPPKPDVIVYKVTQGVDEHTSFEFIEEGLARTKFNEMKGTIAEGDTITLYRVNKTKNTSEPLDKFLKPITPKPDVITFRIMVQGGETLSIANKEEALAKYNEMIVTLEEGKTIELKEVNETQGTDTLIVTYTKPVTPKFNIILFIINLFKKLWKRSGDSSKE